MGHEAKLFALSNLASEIENERVKLLSNMPKPGSHSHNEIKRKIERWQQAIKNVQRDLKSQSHFNHMIHQQNRFGPGSFSANQQLKSREGNVAQLSDALYKVAMALAELMQALVDGPNAETRALEGIKRALSDWQKSAKSQEEGMMGPAPQELQTTIRQLESQMPRGTALSAPGVIDIFTLILSLFVLLKSQKKKD